MSVCLSVCLSLLASAASAGDDYDDDDDYDGDTDEGYNTQQSGDTRPGTSLSSTATPTTPESEPTASLPSSIQITSPSPPPPSTVADVTITVSSDEQESGFEGGATQPASGYMPVTENTLQVPMQGLHDSPQTLQNLGEPSPAPPPPPSLSPSSHPLMEEEPPLFLPEGISSYAELHEKVKKLFPDFKPDGNLHFLSMLGPGRRSSYPKVWQNARKKKKRSCSDEETKTVGGEWTFNFGPDPTPDMCASDDEDKFLAPLDGELGSRRGKQEIVEVDREVTEWRNGPAKVWYDMFNVPENGRGFDYGFKMKKVS